MRLDDLSGLQRLVLPDAWQAAAIGALKAGRDVIVDAPTGAGKTYVFERWAEQTNFSKRALFTVPTRALANDKYAEWKARGWRVGISTGDVTIDVDAPIVVATLEAVQSWIGFAAQGALPESERFAAAFEQPKTRFSLLVIDEYHWLADPYRGNHYEGAIVAADPNVQLLLLSGAVANPADVAGWLTRLGRKVELVQTSRRPVPLEEVDVDDLVHGLPKSVQGFWARRVAGALREGLGPVLVFAPHRQDAERLARQFARELPLPEPLTLTPEQELACGPELTRLLKQRVAYHHSGLSYVQRAGVIEPLAKAGQLRAVVATLGLSAGINFSLRSVMITASSYRFDQLDREIAPHDILQMIGRAGRRGLDETGYVLCSTSTPRMRRAAPLRLKRSAPLPWAMILRQLRGGEVASEVANDIAHRFYTETPIILGSEKTRLLDRELLPCRQLTDTGRARMVRRERDPFAGCVTCDWRGDCLRIDPQSTLLWQWQRCGVLDRDLRLTARGEIVGAFLGPEGLALAAALEDRRYPLEDLIFDCANLYGGDRFAGTNPRKLGRLATVSERAFRRTTVEGYLVEGVPPQYGFGASEIVRAVVEGARARQVLDAQEMVGRGDLDRLLTEWRSLLRQVASAPPLTDRVMEIASSANPEADERARRNRASLSERWDQFRALARAQLVEAKATSLPELPPLTADQRRVVNHRFMRAANAHAV
ncbi:MAG TPA: DEAD/DEAH box helicase [Opitutaceae bacterium]|nr:DEAD/DEAH box helicase [Opitutaceae bacterium]